MSRAASLVDRLHAVLLVGALVGPAGCSLSNVAVDACKTDLACESTFGVGSRCEPSGYCSAPTACDTGHDCRARHGGGACVEGLCRATLPSDPTGACTTFDPDTLPGTRLTGDDAPVLVGAMVLPGSDFSPPILDAARLAIRDINSVGGVTDGRTLGLVVCDTGGPMNSLGGDERRARIHAVVDYLGGTLGVPYVVGPLTSGDAIFAVSRAVARQLPTAFVSPSATSPALTLEPDRLSQDVPYGLFWRTAPSDQLQGQVLAKSVVGSYPSPLDPGKIAHVAVAFRDDAYGQGLADAFLKSFQGKTTLIKFAIGAELAPVVTDVAAAGPDGVMFVDVGGDRALEFIAAMAKAPALASRPLYLADGSKNEGLLDPKLAADVRTIIYDQTFGTVAAAPEGPLFDVFQASYKSEFGGTDPANSAFTANGYDAAYLGAAALVYAAQTGAAFDGLGIAEGLARLVPGGPKVDVGKTQWGALKGYLTSGERKADITGISGALDFDASTGEAPAPIEIWQPTMLSTACNGKPPCFRRLAVVTP
ncbi:MAG: ABC transporter substrate-binding protein [Deltaproteobacteria bacterium]|nr:ABC transporter substrate-binding protein [Deltaproteobacteria bacterium]